MSYFVLLLKESELDVVKWQVVCFYNKNFGKFDKFCPLVKFTYGFNHLYRILLKNSLCEKIHNTLSLLLLYAVIKLFTQAASLGRAPNEAPGNKRFEKPDITHNKLHVPQTCVHLV